MLKHILQPYNAIRPTRRDFRIKKCENIPNIQCIQYMGDGGARIVLDIPASEAE